MAKISRMLIVLACALAVRGTAPAQNFSVIHSFNEVFPGGASPDAPLHRGASGNFYGTTFIGGPYNSGVVFKLDAGGQETILHNFTGGPDGAGPAGGLVADPAGNLYGTTYAGGLAGAGEYKGGAGVVYKIDTAGQFSVLYTFTGGADGSGPAAGVILDRAGNLYGTTYYGGAADNWGVVYKLSPSGRQTVLHTFTGTTDGANPVAGVTLDAAGNLYGTTYYGGLGYPPYSYGVIYKLSPAGQETVLFTFDAGNSGVHPTARVTLDAAGNIYGAAFDIVYRLDTTGHYTALGEFTSTRISGVTRDASGNLFLTASPPDDNNVSQWTYGAVFKLEANGRPSLLYKFPGPGISYEAEAPLWPGINAAVILDSAGNAYGTSPFGGSTGIVYEIENNGAVKVLLNFLPAPGGSHSTSELVLDPAGSFYGTTAAGGGSADAGVVFKMSPAGDETVLYRFKGVTADGADPTGRVVLDRAGNLYGVTRNGGNTAGDYDGNGVVYKVTPHGQESILYIFGGGADGGIPAGLAMDSAGNLYGTTWYGGTSGYDEGTVFKIDPAGNFSVFYTFGLQSGGGYPEAGVIVDAAGNLYGTTSTGVWGTAGSGNIFKIDASGAYTVLHIFSGDDGGAPTAMLSRDAAGNLYGTAFGGALGGGTVFKLDLAGNYTVLYAFASSATTGPSSGVTLDGAGNLYGALAPASTGCPGTPGACGAVYKIDPSGHETVLYSFTGGADGGYPVGLTLDGSRYLYGLASGLWPAPLANVPGVAFTITLP